MLVYDRVVRRRYRSVIRSLWPECWRSFLPHAVKRSADINSRAMDVISFSPLSRKAIETWIKFNGESGNLSQQDIARLFHSVGFFPSKSQVYEIWELTRQSHGPFSLGFFYISLYRMKHVHDGHALRTPPLSKLDSRKQLMKRRSESVESCYDVFLGGSCNPTTWRTDTAIPKLQEFGISYYNPQVAQWVPELIQQENQAKGNAKVMFFVIDNQTRSVACMIEAAHVAGTQRKLVIVVNEPALAGSLVLGEPISEKEYQDLKQGREYLEDIMEVRNIRVFKDIHEALEETNRVVKEDTWPRGSKAEGISVPQETLAPECGKVQAAYNNIKSSENGKVQMKKAKLELRALTGKEIPQGYLDDIESKAQGPLMNGTGVDVDEVSINFNQFSILYGDMKQQNSKRGKLSKIFRCLLSWFRDLVFPKPRVPHGGSLPTDCCHVYLGGATRGRDWRKDIAIPELKKHGLRHSVPVSKQCNQRITPLEMRNIDNSTVLQWNQRFIPLEMRNIDNSMVLLFVITDEERCLSEMLVAAHYVGRGCRVILCIQNLKEGVVIDGEKLTDLAVKDYNRGRMYLSDLATNSGVPVYEDILEAVKAAAELCIK